MKNKIVTTLLLATIISFAGLFGTAVQSASAATSFLDPLTIPKWVNQLTGAPVAPTAEEMGWFDTTITLPGWVTVIRVRYTSQDGTGYTFDATEGSGYVWHCHILEHEDNEMMRPYKVAS